MEKIMIGGQNSVAVDLSMRCDLGEQYSSASQRARVITETWVEDNMYCPACPSEQLLHTRRGAKLVDFTCTRCEEEFQVKSSRHSFGNKVLDSAWGPMEKAVKAGEAPGFFFLRYDFVSCQIEDLFIVPGHFITSQAIEQRTPLKATARRAGWIGCNILLGGIAEYARIPVVEGGVSHSEIDVRGRWRRFAFVREVKPAERGWTADVLSCIQRLGKGEFSLGDIYSFEAELASRHPENRNVRPKIRQQLQILRDSRVLDFLGGGTYRVH